jgi:hypothetical protein
MGHEHHGSHAKAELKLLSSPLISHKEISPGASETELNHHHHGSSDPESLPHQIDDAALHSTPQFQRVSSFLLSPPISLRLRENYKLTLLFISSTKKQPLSKYVIPQCDVSTTMTIWDSADTMKLFYDLFFVANLTTFTSLHEINQGHALASYSGFFW